MNDSIETAAPAPSDADLRTLWQRAGGTIYSANRETGSMPTRTLIPFLRTLVSGAPLVLEAAAAPDMADLMVAAQGAPAAPVTSSAPAGDGIYARALMELVAKVCPGLDTGNLLEDARLATEAMSAEANLVGYFGIDDEPLTDGTARYLQIGSQYKADADVFPLYRRAGRTGERDEASTSTASTSTAAKTAPAKKTATRGNAEGGAS